MPNIPNSPHNHNHNHSRRSDLFVVRIWRDDTGGTPDSTEGEDREDREDRDDEGTQRRWQWQGRIQRAVSGEEHHFRGWPSLLEILEAMLSDTRRVSGRGGITRMRDADHANPDIDDSANFSGIGE